MRIGLYICIVWNRHQAFIHVSPHSSLDHSFQTQILPKTLPVMHIFSFIIIIYLKKFIWIKYLKRNQCPTGLSPIIIPSPPASHLLSKDSKLNWFWLIIAGSPQLSKGVRVGVLSNFKKISGSIFSQKRRGYYERVIYNCCLSLCL